MKRFDKRYGYYSFFSSLRTVAVVLLIFVGNMWDEENLATEDLLAALPFFAVGALVLYLALVAYAWLYVRASGYALTADDIRCKRGVVFRKSSVLPYNKIHAVNKKQGLIQQLFGIATLTVDSGSTTNAFSAEITIIERDETVDRLIAEIRCRQEGTPVTETAIKDSIIPPKKQENLYTFNSKLKVMYAVLSVCGTLLFILVLGALALMGLSIMALVLRATPDFSFVEALFAGLFFMVIGMLIAGIISLIGSLVASFTSYHNFTVHRNKKDLEINYGLFVRHTNNFKFRRIKAVKLTDGPIKRLFGFVAATLEVVGYGNGSDGDSNDNQATAPGMLLPLCKRREADDTIAAILPGYRPDPIAHRAKSYPAFILWGFFGIAVTVVSLFLPVLTVLLLVDVSGEAILYTAAGFAAALAVGLLCNAMFGYFSYRQAGLAIGDGKLTLQQGAIVRTRTVIRAKDIVAVERITTPLRQARGIQSYKIHIFTNAASNTVTVKNLDATLAAQLESILQY